MRGLSIWAPAGFPEIAAGCDLVALIDEIAGGELLDGDFLVVSSKAVSKSQGRFVKASCRDQVIEAETIRVVAERPGPPPSLVIVENRLGVIGAAAGVDASNVPLEMVLLLPDAPDAWARELRRRVKQTRDVSIGVVVTDTVGRPWRTGLVDIAIGLAGFDPLQDLRGQPDYEGRTLAGTVVALADEIAAAADLVKGKLRRSPIAIVRGVPGVHQGGAEDHGFESASALQRPAEDDLFRLGTREAFLKGWYAGRSAETDHPPPGLSNL